MLARAATEVPPVNGAVKRVTVVAGSHIICHVYSPTASSFLPNLDSVKLTLITGATNVLVGAVGTVGKSLCKCFS